MKFNSKILVTGASGMLGHSLLNQLNLNNVEVHGISSKNLDLRNLEKTQDYFQKYQPKIVIHSAAIVGGIKANMKNPVKFIQENLMMQLSVFNACHKANVQKLIFLGSSCMYPKGCRQPMKEEYLLTGHLEPTNSAYAMAKLAGLEQLKAFQSEFGHRWFSIISTNLYGPHDNFSVESSHVIPALISKFHSAVKNDQPEVKIMGTGNAKREFMYVDDLSNAINFLLNNYDNVEPINVGFGSDITIKELVEIVRVSLGFRGKVIYDSSAPEGQVQKLLDSSKISAMGWTPKVSLTSGIQQTVSWFKKEIAGRNG